MSKKNYLIFDYETYSECDITVAGAYEYARHPSTEILCIGYLYGVKSELEKATPKLLIPDDYKTQAVDHEFLRLLTDPDTVLVAHNSFFEQCISKFVLPGYPNLLRSEQARRLPIKRWLCTASLARHAGIPGKLEMAAAALRLKHQKDKEGHRIMLKVSQPRKASKKNPDTRWTPQNAPDDFKRLYSYCLDDVAAERDLLLALPPLPPIERRIWKLDQKMNHRGFAVDRELVQAALDLIGKETAYLDRKFQRLTGLTSARQRDAFLSWLRERGVKLKNMRAETITEYLELGARKGETSDALTALEIRQSTAKSSTAKYAAFDIRSRSDGRARDNTIYYGAHTGRANGTGLQPLNLFKATMPHEDVLAGIELILERDLTAIRALYKRPMELFASVLRSCIRAPKGRVLDVGDFSTIEVRVLFWLAGHKRGLEMLRKGEPIYSKMAAKIFEEDGDEIERLHKAGDKTGYTKRQLGKATVLGAGFGIGLGGEKFVQAAKTLAGLDISVSLAQKCVATYREENPQIVNFWDVIESAAVKALENPGKAYKHGYLIWRKEGDWLTCELPMGRKLYYFKPLYMKVKTLYGEKMALTYRVVDSKTKQFIRVTTWGGKLTENVVQAVARDLLYEALLRLEDAGHKPVLPVHDEIVAERPRLNGGMQPEIGSEMFSLMEQVPVWAPGLPIKVEGWSEERYRK